MSLGSSFCYAGFHLWAYWNVFSFHLPYDKRRKCVRCGKEQVRVHDKERFSGYRWTSENLLADEPTTEFATEVERSYAIAGSNVGERRG